MRTSSMKLNDLKLGTIIRYIGKYETNYAVVIGIFDIDDRKTRETCVLLWLSDETESLV